MSCLAISITSGFQLHVTCLKISLLQFGFSCQSGPDPPPQKKVKPNEDGKKGKKSECCTTESKSQHSVFWNAWLSQFGWLIFDKESQTMKCYVCTDANLQSCLNRLLYNILIFQENFNVNEIIEEAYVLFKGEKSTTCWVLRARGKIRQTTLCLI